MDAAPPDAPTIGVVDGRALGYHDGVGRLAIAVTLAELGRRLGMREVAAFCLGDEPVDSGIAAAAVPLLPWDRSRAERLSNQLDGFVVIGEPALSSQATQVVDDLAVRGCRVEVLSLGLSAPDPLALAWRLFSEPELRDRRQYLDLVDKSATDAPILISYFTDREGEMGEPLVEFAHGAGLGLFPMTGRETPIDLLALLAEASLVVTDSPGIAVLGTGRRCPVILVKDDFPTDGTGLGGCATVVGRAEELLALTGASPRHEAATSEASVLAAEVGFDDLARSLQAESKRRTGAGSSDVLAELAERVAALEAVNEGLRARLEHERSAMAEHARSVSASAASSLTSTALAARCHLEEAARHAAEDQVGRLREEISRIYATRTMRLLAPVRSFYGRMRSRWR